MGFTLVRLSQVDFSHCPGMHLVSCLYVPSVYPDRSLTGCICAVVSGQVDAGLSVSRVLCCGSDLVFLFESFIHGGL